MNRRVAYLLAVLAQLLFLGWMVGAQEHLRKTGRRIVISIEPVDPIDPLAGRYLAIRPRPGRLDLGELPNDLALTDPPRSDESIVGREVDVFLREEGGEWVASYVELAGRERDDALFLRGRVRSASGSLLFVEFGLERFYIPADAADPSPLLWQGGRHLAIAVRVLPSGEAGIEDLLVDHEPFAAWNRSQPK